MRRHLPTHAFPKADAFYFPACRTDGFCTFAFLCRSKIFLQRLFSCPRVQLGRCTSPMHMHSHRHAGHLYNCKLMDHFSSSILEEVLILYVDSSRFYSLLSWLASPQMCAYVLFGKRSTSNSKRGRRSSFYQSLVTSQSN